MVVKQVKEAKRSSELVALSMLLSSPGLYALVQIHVSHENSYNAAVEMMPFIILMKSHAYFHSLTNSIYIAFPLLRVFDVC